MNAKMAQRAKCDSAELLESLSAVVAAESAASADEQYEEALTERVASLGRGGRAADAERPVRRLTSIVQRRFTNRGPVTVQARGVSEGGNKASCCSAHPESPQPPFARAARRPAASVDDGARHMRRRPLPTTHCNPTCLPPASFGSCRTR